MTQRKHKAEIKCEGCGRMFGIIQQSHIDCCLGLARMGIKTRLQYKQRFGNTISSVAAKNLADNINQFNKSMTKEQRSAHAKNAQNIARMIHPDLARRGGIKGSESLWKKEGQKERHTNRLISLNKNGFMTQKPNKLERKFWDLVGIEHLDFVSFSFWKTIRTDRGFSHITPDFRIPGTNAVIEVYGNYWHRNDDPQDRIDLWNSVGVNCMVVWESEINKNPESAKRKVFEYISQNLHECLAPHDLVAGGDIV